MSPEEILKALNKRWPLGRAFSAADVAEYCRPPASGDTALLCEFFDPRAFFDGATISSWKVGKALSGLIGRHFLAGDGAGTIRLARVKDKHSKAWLYHVVGR
jgi:hypothetical protein